VIRNSHKDSSAKCFWYYRRVFSIISSQLSVVDQFTWSLIKPKELDIKFAKNRLIKPERLIRVNFMSILSKQNPLFLALLWNNFKYDLRNRRNTSWIEHWEFQDWYGFKEHKTSQRAALPRYLMFHFGKKYLPVLLLNVGDLTHRWCTWAFFASTGLSGSGPIVYV
jgi:hypothetical protein